MKSLLLLSPDGSRDRAGVVTPTVNGTVSTIAGVYGNAWRFDTIGEYLAVAVANHMLGNVGTVLLRGIFHSDPGGNQTILRTSSITSPNRTNLFRATGTNILFLVLGDQTINTGDAVETGTPYVIAYRYRASGIQVFLDGSAISSEIAWTGSTIGGTQLHVGQNSTALSDTSVESLLIYDAALSDAVIQDISTLPAAWTWKNTPFLADELTAQAVGLGIAISRGIG